MKLAFFQVVLLSVAATASATEVEEVTQEASYLPDWLVQTASFAEYFNPADLEEEHGHHTHGLAQNKATTEASADSEADILNEL